MQQRKKIDFSGCNVFLLILLEFGWPWSVGRVKKYLAEVLYAEEGEPAMKRNT